MILNSGEFIFAKPEIRHEARMQGLRLNRSRTKGAKSSFYTFAVTSIQLEYARGMEIDAQLDALHGEVELFTLPNPFPSQKIQPSLTVTSGGVVGATSITVTGASPNEIQAVVAGDFMQFDTYAPSHRITSTTDAGPSGGFTLHFFPPLREAVPNGTPIRYGYTVEFQVCMIERNSGGVDAANRNFIVHDLVLAEQL